MLGLLYTRLHVILNNQKYTEDIQIMASKKVRQKHKRSKSPRKHNRGCVHSDANTKPGDRAGIQKQSAASSDAHL